MTKEKLKPIDTSKYKITDTGQVLKTIKDEMKGEAVKWHKVADGDLPDNYRYVWTNVGAGYYDDGWWDDFGRLQGVIAWCEPKFEE